MRVLLTTYGSRGDVEPIVGLAVHVGALGAGGAGVRAAALRGAAAQFDTAAAAAEDRDGPVATGVMPTGGWR
jgi:hypothetical protein